MLHISSHANIGYLASMTQSITRRFFVMNLGKYETDKRWALTISRVLHRDRLATSFKNMGGATGGHQFPLEF
jgi:hypothetical protein